MTNTEQVLKDILPALKDVVGKLEAAGIEIDTLNAPSSGVHSGKNMQVTPNAEEAKKGDAKKEHGTKKRVTGEGKAKNVESDAGKTGTIDQNMNVETGAGIGTGNEAGNDVIK